MKKNFVVFSCLLALSNLAYSQVITLHNKINKTLQVKDTQVSIQYFKNIDSAITNRIDSFLVYIKIKYPHYSIDSNFFISSHFSYNHLDNLTLTLDYQFEYNDYLRLTKCGSARNYAKPYAFTFYKNILIIFDEYNHKKRTNLISNTNETCRLVKSLIAPCLSHIQKRQIEIRPKLITFTLGAPIKSYILN